MKPAAITLTCAILALSAVPGGSASAVSGSADVALLQPGAAYVSNFDFEERREACLMLDYAEGSESFSNCLIGDFPQNPWFRS